jgi:hypothetical protein
MSPDQGCALVSSLTSLRLAPTPSGSLPIHPPTVVRQHLGCSGRLGGLQSEVKEEGWRSQPGGHERRRPRSLPELARPPQRT